MNEIFKQQNVMRALSYALYLFVTYIFQTMLLGGIRIWGVSAYFLPAAVAAVALFEGASYGAVFGLVTGIFADMAFVENSVMFTLLFPALAFAIGLAAQFYINRRFVAYFVVAFAALTVTSLTQMLRTLASDGFSLVLLATALLQVFFSLPMAALLYIPPAKWIDRRQMERNAP